MKPQKTPFSPWKFSKNCKRRLLIWWNRWEIEFSFVRKIFIGKAFFNCRDISLLLLEGFLSGSKRLEYQHTKQEEKKKILLKKNVKGLIFLKEIFALKFYEARNLLICLTTKNFGFQFSYDKISLVLNLFLC